ncbi:MAG: ankyrin repeat domain-containing protein [Planctomycetota bacterium]
MTKPEDSARGSHGSADRMRGAAVTMAAAFAAFLLVTGGVLSIHDEAAMKLDPRSIVIPDAAAQFYATALLNVVSGLLYAIATIGLHAMTRWGRRLNVISCGVYIAGTFLIELWELGQSSMMESLADATFWSALPIIQVVLMLVAKDAKPTPISAVEASKPGLQLGCWIAGGVCILLPVSVCLPALNTAREMARRAHCKSNLRQIGLGLAMYRNDFHGHLPPRLSLIYPEYVSSRMVFACMSADDSPGTICAGQPFERHQVSYVYRRLDAALEDISPSESKVILMHDKPGNHLGGANVLFLDGHVEWRTGFVGPDFAPLHVAAAEGNLSAVRCHVRHGEDVNSRDAWGRTPLHWSARNGRRPVTKYLLSHGADVNAEDRDGSKPLGLAEERKRADIVALLRAYAGQWGKESR